MIELSKSWDRVWFGDKSFKGCDAFASGRGAAIWTAPGKSPSFVSAFLVALEISQELFLFSKISFCPNHPLQRLMKLELYSSLNLLSPQIPPLIITPKRSPTKFYLSFCSLFPSLLSHFPSFTNFSFCGIIEIIVTNQGQSRHKMEWNQANLC